MSARQCDDVGNGGNGKVGAGL